MIRAWLLSAAIGGFLSVVVGAMAEHLGVGDRSAELLRTGALYGIVHAAALIAVSAIGETSDRPDPALIISGWGLAGGMLLFSLSLFGSALLGIKQLGFITPLGGLGLLVGWAALALHALRR